MNSIDRNTYWRQLVEIRSRTDADTREYLSKTKKIIIVFVVGQAICLGDFMSTIYLPSLVEIARDLNTSQTSINASVSVYILLMGIMPLFGSTLSDTFKVRRIIFIVCTLVFIFATIAAARAVSATTLILARVIEAIGFGTYCILGAGIVTDIYTPESQGTAMGLMFVGQSIGPVVAPPIGGLLANRFGWRSTFYFMTIIGTIVLIEIFFFLPESYRHEQPPSSSSSSSSIVSTIIEEQTSVQPLPLSLEHTPVAASTAITDINVHGVMTSKPPTKKKSRACQSTFNPIKTVFLLKYPVVMLPAIGTGILFAFMISLETIMPQLLTNQYGLNQSQIGFAFLGAGIGNLLGCVIGGKISDMALVNNAKKRPGNETVLEDRLSTSMWISGFILAPLGALLFGWGSEYKTQIGAAAPIAGFAIYNYGMGQVLTACAAYAVNCIPDQGSSVMAAASMVHVVMSFFLSLSAQSTVQKMGYGMYSIFQTALIFFFMGLFYIVKFKGSLMRGVAAESEENAKNRSMAD